jgi:hypothetical protein
MEDFMKQRDKQDHQAIEELMKEKAEKIDFTTCRTSRRITRQGEEDQGSYLRHSTTCVPPNVSTSSPSFSFVTVILLP